MINIKIGNLPIEKVAYVKFLGVPLDKNLAWKYHLTTLSKKLARACGMFFNIRHFLPVNVRICLYNSLFSSFFQYGILVWGLTYESYVNPVLLHQKRVIWAITYENSTSHSTPVFSALRIFKLYDISKLKLLTFVYESAILPACFHNFFKPVASVHQHCRQQADQG